MIVKRLELFLSAVAVVISVVAAALSWWQLSDARRHNRLSLRPLLLITPYLEGPGGRNGVYLSNQGLGPAVLTSLRVNVSGQVYEGLGESRWQDALRKAGVEPLCFSQAWPNERSVLKVGDEVALLAQTKAKDTPCLISVVELLTTTDITMRLGYESLYGESYESLGSARMNMHLPR